MSFLSEIQGFKKAVLKTASTLITTADGSQYMETRDKYGHHKKTLVAVGATLGYLADVKPDLQVGEILPGLILGSQDVAADLAVLGRYSVTHILNVASMVENLYPDDYQYKRLDIYDLPETDIVRYFPECFQFISAAIEGGGRVLVHCNAGVSRSSSIVIGYLMQYHNMTFQQAYDHVKEKRPATRPNDGFMKQLKDFKPNKL